jgi:hypothetical protein
MTGDFDCCANGEHAFVARDGLTWHFDCGRGHSHTADRATLDAFAFDLYGLDD